MATPPSRLFRSARLVVGSSPASASARCAAGATPPPSRTSPPSRDEGVFALLLRVIVLVDAPDMTELAREDAAAGSRADVTGAPVHRVRMGVLRPHVHLASGDPAAAQETEGLLTLPERTRAAGGRRLRAGGSGAAYAITGVGAPMAAGGCCSCSGGGGACCCCFRNLRGCLRLRRSVGRRRRRPRRRSVCIVDAASTASRAAGRALVVGSRRRGVAVRRRADQARAFAVARGVPAVEVGRRRSGAARRGTAAARRLRLRLRLRPALVEELDLVLDLAHDGPNVALGELTLHHLARRRRAVRVRVRKLHRAGVARASPILRRSLRVLSSRMRPLTRVVNRLLPTALPRLALFGRRLRGGVAR